MASRGFRVFRFGSGFSRRRPVSVLPAADLLLAPGAISVHRSGLETAFFQPALDLVFGEADVRFNPQMRYESAHTIKNAMIRGRRRVFLCRSAPARHSARTRVEGSNPRSPTNTRLLRHSPSSQEPGRQLRTQVQNVTFHKPTYRDK